MGGVKRKVIVTCDDVDCKFMLQCRSYDKQEGECALSTADAIMFKDKYGVDTCTVGMGEAKVGRTPCENEVIIRNLRNKGRM